MATSKIQDSANSSDATRRIVARRRFEAPATLMLVAHVEQEGVWLVEGGMHALARTLEACAKRKGAAFQV